MSIYKVKNLNEGTTQTEQNALSAAITNVSGVKRVKILPKRGEIDLQANVGFKPGFDEINDACNSCGFNLRAQQ